VASAEKTRVEVTLGRPMGLVLDPIDASKGRGGKGAVVLELVEGGSADSSGMIEIGDVLIGCGFDASTENNMENAFYETILDTLGQEPDRTSIKLAFERVVLVDNQDMLGITADAKRYWEEKREAKLRAPKALRRTPGVEPEDIRVNVKGGPLGSGSFGTVFRGTFKGQDVVLKIANKTTMAAEELLECEMDLNYEVNSKAKGTCAKFMGCIEIDPRKGGELYNGTLTDGLWLMWANEGMFTVEQLMNKGTAQLAEAMGCTGTTELAVTRKAMTELMTSLSRLHAAGIVHRDVKPANLIAAEKDGGVLKLIDLGAAALCLEKPLNYYPGVGPADPRYCKADEMYLLPTGAPRPDPKNMPKLWAAHTPDRLDCFSAGVTMMQLAVPGLRPEAALATFMKEYATTGYDLKAWSDKVAGGGGGFKQGVLDFGALDANGGAGWDLAQRLMDPERAARISAEAALKHPFLAA